MESRVALDETKMNVENLKHDLELEVKKGEDLETELSVEREKATNLQSVLEDFQLGISFLCLVFFRLVLPFTAKDHELRQAVQEREAQYNQVTQALAEFKHRALTAEVRLTFPDVFGLLLSINHSSSLKKRPPIQVGQLI